MVHIRNQTRYTAHPEKAPFPDGSFTPGPWIAEKNAARGAWIKGSTGEWAALACGDNDQSAAANARLIAAAPELYASAATTLKGLDAEYGIAEHDDGWIYDVLGPVLSGVYFTARLALSKATGGQHV